MSVEAGNAPVKRPEALTYSYPNPDLVPEINPAWDALVDTGYMPKSILGEHSARLVYEEMCLHALTREAQESAPRRHRDTRSVWQVIRDLPPAQRYAYTAGLVGVLTASVIPGLSKIAVGLDFDFDFDFHVKKAHAVGESPQHSNASDQQPIQTDNSRLEPQAGATPTPDQIRNGIDSDISASSGREQAPLHKRQFPNIPSNQNQIPTAESPPTATPELQGAAAPVIKRINLPALLQRAQGFYNAIPIKKTPDPETPTPTEPPSPTPSPSPTPTELPPEVVKVHIDPNDLVARNPDPDTVWGTAADMIDDKEGPEDDPEYVCSSENEEEERLHWMEKAGYDGEERIVTASGVVFDRDAHVDETAQIKCTEDQLIGRTTVVVGDKTHATLHAEGPIDQLLILNFGTFRVDPAQDFKYLIYGKEEGAFFREAKIEIQNAYEKTIVIDIKDNLKITVEGNPESENEPVIMDVLENNEFGIVLEVQRGKGADDILKFHQWDPHNKSISPLLSHGQPVEILIEGGLRNEKFLTKLVGRDTVLSLLPGTRVERAPIPEKLTRASLKPEYELDAGLPGKLNIEIGTTHFGDPQFIVDHKGAKRCDTVQWSPVPRSSVIDVDPNDEIPPFVMYPSALHYRITLCDENGLSGVIEIPLRNYDVDKDTFSTEAAGIFLQNLLKIAETTGFPVGANIHIGNGELDINKHFCELFPDYEITTNASGIMTVRKVTPSDQLKCAENILKAFNSLTWNNPKTGVEEPIPTDLILPPNLQGYGIARILANISALQQEGVSLSAAHMPSISLTEGEARILAHRLNDLKLQPIPRQVSDQDIFLPGIAAWGRICKEVNCKAVSIHTGSPQYPNSSVLTYTDLVGRVQYDKFDGSGNPVPRSPLERFILAFTP